VTGSDRVPEAGPSRPRRRRRASTLEGNALKRPRRIASAPELQDKVADIEARVARSIREFETAVRVASEKLLAMSMLGGELRAALLDATGDDEEDEEGDE
jgi:hypothetical protein